MTFLLFVGEPMTDHGVLVEDYVGSFATMQDAKDAVPQDEGTTSREVIIAQCDGNNFSIVATGGARMIYLDDPQLLQEWQALLHNPNIWGAAPPHRWEFYWEDKKDDCNPTTQPTGG